MNALPAEGDYKKLMADFRKNVKPMLLDPGKKISTQKMPKAKAGYLYDRYMDKFAGVYKTKRALPKLTAAFANRPTADMTPRELAVHVSTQVEAFKREMAKNDRDDWAKPQAKKPDKAQLSDWFKKRKAEYDKYFSDTVKSDLATEMAVPEFVIADTNWGDEGNHQLFVIAPDPLTGEPDLWSKSVIGGKLSQVDDRWLKAEWSKISK